MRNKKTASLLICFLTAAFLMPACTSKKVSWYFLSTDKAVRHKIHTKHTKLVYVGLDKVELPEYLDHDKITTRTSSNELHKEEFHRWAEPLSKNITRVVGLNIHNKIRNIEIENYPWPYGIPIKYRLQIKIIRFDSDAYCVSHLIATWAIFNNDESALIYQRTKSYRARSANKNVDSIVKAMNRNINHFSDDVARSLSHIV